MLHTNNHFTETKYLVAFSSSLFLTFSYWALNLSAQYGALEVKMIAEIAMEFHLFIMSFLFIRTQPEMIRIGLGLSLGHLLPRSPPIQTGWVCAWQGGAAWATTVKEEPITGQGAQCVCVHQKKSHRNLQEPLDESGTTDPCLHIQPYSYQNTGS